MSISQDLINEGRKTMFRGKTLDSYSKDELMGMIAWLLRKQRNPPVYREKPSKDFFEQLFPWTQQ